MEGIREHRSLTIGVVVLAGVLGVASGIAARQPPNSAGGSASLGQKGQAHVPACGEGASTIAFVVRLGAGSASRAVSAPGLAISALVAEAGGPTAKPGGPDIVVAARRVDGSEVTEEEVEGLPEVIQAGRLLAQSANPKLRSCDYALADKPAAVALRGVAITALISAGSATKSQLEADTTIWTASDHPLDSGAVIMSAQVLGEEIDRPSKGDTTVFGHSRFVVVIDADGDLREAGQAAW